MNCKELYRFDAPRVDLADQELLSSLRETLLPEYSPVLALHSVYGKESPSAKHDFTNVLHNQSLKALVGLVITDMLAWNKPRQHQFVNAAIAPNSDLYMRIHPGDFTESDKHQYSMYKKSLFLNEQLVDAAGPTFFTSGRWLKNDVTEDEQLMVLVTDLVEERRPHHLALVNPEAHILEWMIEARAELGREYWMNELKHDYKTIHTFFPDIKTEDFPDTIYRLLLDKVGH